jgi:3-hydroxyisobutyrate dehydrogenase-like beta-hydroxyacid dehydrogenase
MTDISALGLGRMGSALARCLVKAGHGVTVWNRSLAKAETLVQRGAIAADSVPAAVAASPVVVICIDGYRSTQALFEAPAVARLLPGKTIVQVSTGSPKAARAAEAWFTSAGAHYLDGAILAGPSAIGSPGTTILYAGHRGAFDGCCGVLGSLGGDTRFVGENVGSASAIDLAWLSKLYGALAGAAHGTVICETEGVDLGMYASVFPENDGARWMIDVVRKGGFSNPGATLAVWNAALHRVQDQAREAGINSEVPDFIADILHRAEAAGHGDEHIAAMVKILRAPPRV